MSATVATVIDARSHVGKIGPNAITRIIEALGEAEGAPSVRRIFQAAHLEGYLFESPIDMVDERDVARLHQTLHDDLGDARARSVGRIAGRRTADYLLSRRIPRPAQIALRCLPAGLASRTLAKAIAKNAWTFVGTGAFSATYGRPTTFTIRDCPICRSRRSAEPYCDFYAATFERLYARLVNHRARVSEVRCRAMGAPACAFEIRW